MFQEGLREALVKQGKIKYHEEVIKRLMQRLSRQQLVSEAPVSLPMNQGKTQNPGELYALIGVRSVPQ